MRRSFQSKGLTPNPLPADNRLASIKKPRFESEVHNDADSELPNGDLRINVTPEEQAELQSNRRDLTTTDGTDTFGSNDVMYEVFSALTENTDLEWCQPEWVGALTSAPMFALFGEDVPINEDDEDGFYWCAGRWVKDGVLTTFKRSVDKVWSFMDYALRSPQEDLAEKGYYIFQSGNEEDTT